MEPRYRSSDAGKQSMSDKTGRVVEDRTEDGLASLQELQDSIDVLALKQILDMDDDGDERVFSRATLFGYFEQAEQTFTNMDDALVGDLALLSSLGHLLKGSSAAVGLVKVKESCRKIQYYGQKKDETGRVDEPDEAKCLSRIQDTLVTVKVEYAEAKTALKKVFGS